MRVRAQPVWAFLFLAAGVLAVVVLVLAPCGFSAGCKRPGPVPEAAGAGPVGGGIADVALSPPVLPATPDGGSPAPSVAEAAPEAEPAETAWHEPVPEREPATDAARKITETLRSVEEQLTETKYQHSTVVRESRGIYDWDCAGMTAWVLERAAPNARAALSDDQPPAREFYDRIEESPTDEPRRGWLRLARPEDIAPGDLFAWRKPDFWPDRPNTGHVGFVLDTPQPHPSYRNVWVLRVADATRMLHEADSRPEGGEGGFGTGTMAFLFDDDGAPVAYGWYGAGQDPGTFVPTRIAFGRVSR